MSKLKKLRNDLINNEKDLEKLYEEKTEIDKKIEVAQKDEVDIEELGNKISQNSLALEKTKDKNILKQLVKEQKALKEQKVKAQETEKKLQILAKEKSNNSLSIANAEQKQDELEESLDSRFQQLSERSDKLSKSIVKNEKEEFTSIGIEIKEHTKFKEERALKQEKKYQSEKKILIQSLGKLLNEKNQGKLGEILVGLVKGTEEKKKGLNIGKGVFKGIGFVFSNLGTILTVATSSPFLKREAEKMAKVLSGERKYDGKNPPFFMRLLQDNELESFLQKNPQIFAGLLDNVVPSIVPVILTELGKVDAINKEIKSKEKKFKLLPEIEKQIADLENKNKQVFSQGRANEIAKLKEKIAPLKKLQFRAQIANTIDVLKKSGVGAEYINEKLLPIITGLLKELLENPKNLLEIADLALKMVQSKDESDKSQFLGQILNKLDITQILESSKLGPFLKEEGNKLTELAITTLESNEILKNLAPKNGVEKKIINSIVPVVAKLAGTVVGHTEGVVKVFEALKPVILDDTTTKIKQATSLEEITKLDKESSEKKLKIATVLPDILLKEDVLEIVTKELPKILSENKEAITKTVSGIIPGVFEGMQQDVIALSKLCNKDLDKNKIVQLLAPPPALLLQGVTSEFYENILPPVITLAESVLSSVQTKQVLNVYNNVNILLGESDQKVKDEAVGNIIKEALHILGSEKFNKALSEDVASIFTNEKVLAQLPKIVDNALKNIPGLKKQTEDLVITPDFVKSSLPFVTSIASSALPLVSKVAGKLAQTPEELSGIYKDFQENNIPDLIEKGSKIVKNLSPALDKDLPEFINQNKDNLVNIAKASLEIEPIEKLVEPLGINSELVEKVMPQVLDIASSSLPLVNNIAQRMAKSPEQLSGIYSNFVEFQKEDGDKDKALSGLFASGAKIMEKLTPILAPSTKQELYGSLPEFLTKNKKNIENIISEVIKQPVISNTLAQLGISPSLVNEATSASIDLIAPMLPVITKLINSSLKDQEGLKAIINQVQETINAPREQQEKHVLKLVGSILAFKDNNPEVKQVIEQEIPEILKNNAATLGPVIDKFLNQTPIGKNLRIKGEDMLNVAAKKMPQLVEAADLFTKKQYGKLIPKAFKILFDKDVLKLAVTAAVDIIKMKYHQKTRWNSTRRTLAGTEVNNALVAALREKGDIGKTIEEKGKETKGKTAKYSMVNRDFHGLHFDKQELEFDNCKLENFNFKDAKFGKASFKGTEIINCNFDKVEFKEKIDFTGMKIDQKSLESLKPAVERYNKKHPENQMALKYLKVNDKKLELTKAIEQIKKNVEPHKTKGSDTGMRVVKTNEKKGINLN